HNFINGEAVTYGIGSGSASDSGLTVGRTYYVIVVDANTIKLADSPDNAKTFTEVVLNGNGSGDQSLTLNAGSNRTLVDRGTYLVERQGDNLVQLRSGSEGNSTNTAVIAIDASEIKGNHKLAKPWEVPILGLVNGQTYFVVKSDANSFQLSEQRPTATNQDGTPLTGLNAVGIKGGTQQFAIDAVDLRV